MTLGQLREKTKDLPDNTELLLPEVEMPGWRAAYHAQIARVGRSMTGPYPLPRPSQDDEQWGVFLR